MKVDFFDAGSVTSTDGVDGIHFTAKNNADLGKAIAAKVEDIFAPQSKEGVGGICHA
jgi:lysophospholipase L1-like esterase